MSIYLTQYNEQTKRTKDHHQAEHVAIQRTLDALETMLRDLAERVKRLESTSSDGGTNP